MRPEALALVNDQDPSGPGAGGRGDSRYHGGKDVEAALVMGYVLQPCGAGDSRRRANRLFGMNAPRIMELLTAGQRSQREGNLPEAERNYRRVLEENPYQAEAWLLLGGVCSARGGRKRRRGITGGR